LGWVQLKTVCLRDPYIMMSQDKSNTYHCRISTVNLLTKYPRNASSKWDSSTLDSSFPAFCCTMKQIKAIKVNIYRSQMKCVISEWAQLTWLGAPALLLEGDCSTAPATPRPLGLTGLEGMRARDNSDDGQWREDAVALPGRPWSKWSKWNNVVQQPNSEILCDEHTRR
jgi:hypothetical protein